MSDIFRDLSIKQQKPIDRIPAHYRKQAGIRKGQWRKEEHISTIMLRVIVKLCDQSTQYHKEHAHENL